MVPTPEGASLIIDKLRTRVNCGPLNIHNLITRAGYRLLTNLLTRP